MRKCLLILMLLSICGMTACGSKKVIPEEKDITIVLEEQGGETPEIIVTPVLEKWSMDAFSGDIAEVPGIIAAQFENYSLHSSVSPDFYYVDFTSSQELLDYLSLEQVKVPQWDLSENLNSITIYGTEEGEFKEVILETTYATDNIGIQSFARIYGKESETVEMHLLEHTGVFTTVEDYYNENGKYVLLTDASESEYGTCGMDAYFVEDNVFYNVHIAYRPEHEAEAREWLEKWAELW